MELRGVPSTAWCCDLGVAAGVVLRLFLLLPVRTAFWVRGGVLGDISGGGGSSLCMSLDCTSDKSCTRLEDFTLLRKVHGQDSFHSPLQVA